MMILSSTLVVGCFGAAQQRSTLGEGLVNDMVRFGAALKLTRGATNEWDINAGQRTGWKAPQYRQINTNTNLRDLHVAGSTLVHNYMDSGKENTCLYSYGRMTADQFNTTMQVVSRCYAYVATITPQFCEAQGYVDAQDVANHWADYHREYNACVLQSWGNLKPLVTERSMPLHKSVRDSIGGDDASASDMADAKRFPMLKHRLHEASMRQQARYDLNVTDDEKINYARLAVLTYLSRGLCDYFNNNRSPLDKHTPGRPRGTWLTDPLRNGFRLDTQLMMGINTLGNIIAHQRSQTGVELDEYSFWIVHLEDKINQVIRSPNTTLNLDTLTLRTINGDTEMANPFQERLRFIQSLKGNADMRPLWPYEKPGQVGIARFLTMADFTSRMGGAVYQDANVSYRQNVFLWRWPQGKSRR